MALTGEGACEGLSALFDVARDDETAVLDFDGFIFESGLPAVPPFPEPPASRRLGCLRC